MEEVSGRMKHKAMVSPPSLPLILMYQTLRQHNSFPSLRPRGGLRPSFSAMVCGVVVAAGGACPPPFIDITLGMAGPLHGVETVPLVPVWNGHGRSPAQCGNGVMVMFGRCGWQVCGAMAVFNLFKVIWSVRIWTGLMGL